MSKLLLVNLIKAGLGLTLIFGFLYGVGKWVDKANPDDRKHRPTRYEEAVAPYVIAIGLLGMAVGGIGLLIRYFSGG